MLLGRSLETVSAPTPFRNNNISKQNDIFYKKNVDDILYIVTND